MMGEIADAAAKVHTLEAEIERLTKDRDMWLADDAKQNNSVGRLTAQLTAANAETEKMKNQRDEAIVIANNEIIGLRSQVSHYTSVAGPHREWQDRAIQAESQLTTEREKVEKAREALKEWKRQIEQVISWGNAFLGEKFDRKMQENLLSVCNQAIADTEVK